MASSEKNKIESRTLYLVATPIGNLLDITERAKKTLAEVDFVAAEDTRNSYKLLSCYGIENELVSYHEHNKAASGERIVARLLSGESCALITDAGMPAISDPGEDLVRLCQESGIAVKIVPGASAAVSALALSGLSTARFAFEGFLSANKGERRKRLEKVKSEERTLIFYEAPHKLKATLTDMAEIFGAERKVTLCKELTKINEAAVKTALKDAVAYYEANEPKGEYVLVVEGAVDTGEENELNSLSLEEHLSHYIGAGLSKKDAIKAVAKDRHLSKSEVYSAFTND